MKVKLKDLTDDAEKCANDLLSGSFLWWHLAPKGEDAPVSLYV
jgi:hypothetical protein